MDLMEKLTILVAGAKYDAACTSSGADRPGKTVMAGCCHTFSADGRCVSLLKVLMTNYCVYDCKYCVNRASNDCRRTAFTPEELAGLTVEFYRRNYIEGLFLSSGVIRSPDYTMERIIQTLQLLRRRYDFRGYIHAKTIPGAAPELVRRLGLLADRLSVNVELPSERSLNLLAPNKKREAIFSPMKQIRLETEQNRQELVVYKKAPQFAPAGQATQMIIGASPETDYQIITLAAAMYGKYALKRVFYSAYIPAVADSLLPAPDVKPPLLREHRLYQADWLLRQYGFGAEEILSPETPNFNPYLDPKCNWAINNMHRFPVDVNAAGPETLLRVPGIGPTSARRIVAARRNGRLGVAELKRIGVVWKRAQYFTRTSDWPPNTRPDKRTAIRALIDSTVYAFGAEQISLFQDTPGIRPLPTARDVGTVAEAVEEAVLCLASSL
ncbi:MAG: putative DNA modification/repair radical SAM protein [Oscillospiraceae bacterium]|jgi:putative DNA modification/repair radical SAM protein|nr:putative DNA modification/repair radical SAM protein [Oscillospiraceae bacterium]